MTILHVIATLSRGGAENHLVTLAQSQLNYGHKVIIAYLQGDGYWKPHLEKKEIKVINLELKYRHYLNLQPIIKIIRVIKECKPEVIHAHLSPAELFTRIALLFYRKKPALPFITTKHNDERFWRLPGHRLVARWVGLRLMHMITISMAVKNYLILNRIYPKEKQNISVIHYGIRTEQFEKIDPVEVKKARQNWGGEFIIGTIARLEPQKAIHYLLNAYNIYLKKSKLDSRLVIVGSGSLEFKLKKMTSQLAIDNYVVWNNFREDIPVVMNSFDCFALVSAYEGFGLVLLEAMAASRPIIATKVSAIPEIVLDKENGVLVDYGNTDQIAAAIHYFENKEIRNLLGAAGNKRAKEYFSVSNMVDQTEHIYRTSCKM